MSDPNPLADPLSENYSLNHEGPQVRTANSNAVRRPSGVTAFAIIGIFLGALRVLSSGFGLIAKLFGINLNQSGPLAELESIMLYRVFQYVNFAIALLLGIALVVIGIRLLKMSDWARRMIVPVAITEIILILTVLAINVTFLISKLGQNMGDGIEAAAVAGVVFVAFFAGLVFAMIYPVAALWYFRRHSVKEAFANWKGDPEA